MKIKVERACLFCGTVFVGTYKSRYCKNAHKQAAYRQRYTSNVTIMTRKDLTR